MKTCTFILVLAPLLLFSCQKNDLHNGAPPAAVAADDGGSDAKSASSLAAYKLPASDDYASIPQDPKNPITTEKVELGKLLFYETRLSSASQSVPSLQTYSCATCHHPEAGFQSGLAQAIGDGGIGFGTYGEGRVANPDISSTLVDAGPIRTPSVLNTAYQEVLMWNGQFGSTGPNAGTEANWTPGTPKYNNYLGYQGLETTGLGAESRHHLDPDIDWLSSNATYKSMFDAAFPDLPSDQRITAVTVSLAMAAYQRTLLPNQSPFQLWLHGDKTALNKYEKNGKDLFFGKAKCYTCHSGPGLNGMDFYALGMNDLTNGVGGAFNVDPKAVEHRGRGGFTGKKKEMYMFKVPQLYNLKDVHYLGHGSSFNSVEDVIRYINAAVPQNPNVPTSQLASQFQPLNLTDDEIQALVAFVQDALYDPNLSRYLPASLPSGSCIPNNDAQSRADRGCN